ARRGGPRRLARFARLRRTRRRDAELPGDSGKRPRAPGSGRLHGRGGRGDEARPPRGRDMSRPSELLRGPGDCDPGGLGSRDSCRRVTGRGRPAPRQRRRRCFALCVVRCGRPVEGHPTNHRNPHGGRGDGPRGPRQSLLEVHMGNPRASGGNNLRGRRPLVKLQRRKKTHGFTGLRRSGGPNPGRVKARRWVHRPVRVCIVLHTDLFEPWPIVRPMFEARILRRLGREVTVFSWIKDVASPLPEEEVRDGLRIRRRKVATPRGLLGRTVGFRRITKQFAEEIGSLRPDAIICHDLEMLWASVRAGRALRIPVLYHAHEDWPAMVSERSRLEGLLFGLLERRLVRFVDHIYAAGEERARRYWRCGKAVTVIYGAKSLFAMPSLSEADRLAIRAVAGFTAADAVLGI